MASAAAEAPAAELDAACVTHVLRFVSDPATFGAALRVCRLWRACGADPRLPYWAELDAARYAGLCDAPFCACVAAAFVRHAAPHLRRVDLSAATACDACRLVEPTGEEAELQYARLQPTVLDMLLAAGAAALPALEELNLSVTPLAARRNAALFGRGVADWQLARCGAAAAPALRVLHFSNCRALDGSALSALLDGCPSLQELYVAGAPLLEVVARRVLAPRALRVNLLDAAPLPRAVDVLCGICAAPLLRGLTAFSKAPPTQPHIDEEWYCNVAPDAAAVVPMQRGSGQPELRETLNCVRNCHAQHGLYLIDGGTGAVALHGWRFGIAVGGGGRRTRGRDTPPLARIVVAP